MRAQSENGLLMYHGSRQWGTESGNTPPVGITLCFVEREVALGKNTCKVMDRGNGLAS